MASPLWRCRSFYKLSNVATQEQASSALWNGLRGQSGRYFTVRNNDSE
jgi:hypothetical protein